MSNPINYRGRVNPAHEAINSCGLAYLIGRDSAIGPEELRRFASELMRAVSESCFGRGAKHIGHIKAYIEHDSGFLYADTLGEASDINVEGDDGEPAREFRLTLNSVVLGISADAVKAASEESVRKVLGAFGFQGNEVGDTCD